MSLNTSTASLPPNDVIPSTSADRLTSRWNPSVKSTHHVVKETTKGGLTSDSASKTTVPGDKRKDLIYDDPIFNGEKCSHESDHDCPKWRTVPHESDEEWSFTCRGKLSTDEASRRDWCLKYVRADSRQACSTWNDNKCCGKCRIQP
ncbi:Hypp6361 [Branchiostoma lanceolatum]|uniref:Hypp6361 protein n=1 Tax=Branchiostoma lanceolatum TaxID=7740 RepID=A0A8K0E5L2_BRALA|nr:Hypp6361 [Branchiostoma lanceolatum]